MTQEVKPTGKPEVEEFKGERSKKLLKCSTDATAHMKEHFKQVRERVAQREPVLWTYTDTPWMIFNAMDILYLDSVHYGSLCSAKQMSRYYLDELNFQGYFRDLCRYCTVSLGVVFDNKPEIAPWGGLPKFTAAIHYHQDDPCLRIWEVYNREMNIPMYTIDRPYPTRMSKSERWWEDFREADVNVVEPHRLDFMVEELEGMIRFLETVTGKHFSETRLREAIERRDKEVEYYWRATDLACGTVPFPISYTDSAANIAAFYYFPGTQWAVDHARKYYEEVKERVDKKEAVCKNEKVRLVWEGVPPWFTAGLFNFWEESHGAVFLPVGYFPPEGQSIRRDISDPLRNIASRMINGFVLSRIPTFRSPFAVHTAKKYKVNGAVFLSAESCKTIYAANLFARRALEEADIPTVEIYADMVDARDWDDVKIKSIVTGLIETIMP